MSDNSPPTWKPRPDSPVRFRRDVLKVPEQVPVHFFQRQRAARPGVVVISGGVDTWKMDLHRLAVATALATGLLVAAVDMPGTGESTVPLSPDADRILIGLVAELRRAYGHPVGFYGISFGGHWAAKLALTGQVDAAVDLGGPIGASDEHIDVPHLPHGMAGIICNALHLDEMPDTAVIDDLLARFSLRKQGLLDAPGGSPLLAVNARTTRTSPWETRPAWPTAPKSPPGSSGTPPTAPPNTPPPSPSLCGAGWPPASPRNAACPN